MPLLLQECLLSLVHIETDASNVNMHKNQIDSYYYNFGLLIGVVKSMSVNAVISGVRCFVYRFGYYVNTHVYV